MKDFTKKTQNSECLSKRINTLNTDKYKTSLQPKKPEKNVTWNVEEGFSHFFSCTCCCLSILLKRTYSCVLCVIILNTKQQTHKRFILLGMNQHIFPPSHLF